MLAAADVLQRSGYEATTMKDIAASVKLTAASLYHHFRNKDALLLAVLEAGLDHVMHQTEAIAQSHKPAEEKLRQMIHAHVVGVTQNTAVGAAMVFEIRSLMGAKTAANGSIEDQQNYFDFIERRDAFFAHRDYFENLFRQVIREGISEGSFRSVDVGIYVKTMLGAHNWVAVWYKPEGRLTGAQVAELMAETFLRGLKKF